VRGAIRQFLETSTLYRCDQAGDGFSAIKKAEDNLCELVLLDIAMPGLNGVETASILRRRLPEVKIVAFSALAQDDDFKRELLDTKKFDAVLSKSDGLDQLMETLQALLPSPR
jgi:CheY-like chemotaxis protein